MLDAAACAHLGVVVRVSSARRPLPLAALVGGERARLDGLASESRRRDWLLGRAALKALTAEGADTSQLAFPHPRLSLTHADGAAFAVRIDADVAGTGIDFERRGKGVDPRVSRFFLRPVEVAEAEDADSLLRLWTVKEALYKATPDNAEGVLVDYQLADAKATLGTALGPGDEELRYASVMVAAGVVTVAVCVTKARPHVLV